VQGTSANSWELDLKNHSKASAITAVRWWLEEVIGPWLDQQPSSVYSTTTVEFIARKERGRELQGVKVKEGVSQALLTMGVPLDANSSTGLDRLAIDCAGWMQQRRE
jgi:hypothetical protein